VSEGKKRRRGRGEGACFYSEAAGAWIGRVAVGKLPSGKTRYRQAQGRSKAQCLQRMRAIEDEVKEGRERATRLTVGDYLTRWLEDTARPTLAERSYEKYEEHARVHILPALSHVLLARLDLPAVEAFYAGMRRRGCSPRLCRMVGGTLGTALRHAAKLGLIPRAPTDVIRPPRADRVNIDPFTQEEARAILEAASGSRHEAFFALAFATGARLGELAALEWFRLDLDGEAPSLRVEQSLYRVEGAPFKLKAPKSRAGRRQVSLPPFAAEALLALRACGRATPRDGNPLQEPVFATRKGDPLSKRYVCHAWRGLLRRAGVRHRKFHTCRHTHASQLLARGVSITEVARRIGDRPETVLRVYAHHLPADGQVAAKLQALYGG
jgi:integrase